MNVPSTVLSIDSEDKKMTTVGGVWGPPSWLSVHFCPSSCRGWRPHLHVWITQHRLLSGLSDLMVQPLRVSTTIVAWVRHGFLHSFRQAATNVLDSILFVVQFRMAFAFMADTQNLTSIATEISPNTRGGTNVHTVSAERTIPTPRNVGGRQYNRDCSVLCD